MRKCLIYVAVTNYENEIARSECRCDQSISLLEWDDFAIKSYEKRQLGRLDLKATAAPKKTA